MPPFHARSASRTFSLLCLGFATQVALAGLAGCGGSSAATGDAGEGDLPMDQPAPDLMGSMSPAACAALKLTARAMNRTGPFGTLRDTLADDFTLTDQNGDWNLAKSWTGCESYVFVPDNVSVSALDRTSIWSTDLDALLAKSNDGAQNVHYFFVSAKLDPAPSLMLLSSQLDAALAPFPDGDGPGSKGWWRAHVHFVQTPLSQLTNWIGRTLKAKQIGDAGFAIDRFQRLRGLGNFADVERFDGNLQAKMQWPWQNNLAYAAHPPIYFNYEAARAERIAAEQGATVIKVFDHQMLVGDQPQDVMFPDAATMAGFDNFEMDITLDCPDPTAPEEANNCGAWDYMIGVSFDAIDNLVAPGDAGVPDGGVAPPPPPKEGHEAARFVTTYHRAGSFTLDVTHVLPYLLKGGLQRMLLTVGGQGYDTTLTFRLRNAGKGMHPTKTTFLYWGGVFDKNYDANHKNIVSVPVPALAKRVELRATITGHSAETSAQCAEFCNHQHQFVVNGKAHLREFPDAGSAGDPEGCLKSVAQGAVPNQSGTWWLGRGGWCPGMQVEPWIVDVTTDVTPGATATVSYQGLFMNKPPATSLGKIDMGSWMTIWE